MNFRTELRRPPRERTEDGSERRLGIELEFAAVSARDGAHLVQQLFGGTIEEEDPHRYHISDTRFGRFTCELDTQYAHRSYADKGGEMHDEDALSVLLSNFQREMRALYGDLSSLVVPCEIVCPPLAVSNLPKLNALVEALFSMGAEGTRSNPFYAFGAQLNPEIASKDAAWLTAMLKAYLLLSEWLRGIMDIDPTRRLVAFAQPFPVDYVLKVVDPNYTPDLDRLIDDYLLANPTRNRELDMLPLFDWLDEARVRRAVFDHRIRARPTFHYRLPDANLGQPGWSLTLEWNRWCVVEHLAEDRDMLSAMGDAYITNRARLLPANWAIKSTEWLVLS